MPRDIHEKSTSSARNSFEEKSPHRPVRPKGNQPQAVSAHQRSIAKALKQLGTGLRRIPHKISVCRARHAVTNFSDQEPVHGLLASSHPPQ